MPRDEVGFRIQSVDRSRLWSSVVLQWPPIQLNRRRFLGLLGRGGPGDVAGQPGRGGRARCRIASGSTGLDRDRQSRHDPAAERARAARALRSSPSATPSRKHRLRGQGIVEKAQGQRARGLRRPRQSSSNAPTSMRSSSRFRATCTPTVYADAIAAGKHLYAEKPLGIDPGRMRPADRRLARSRPRWPFTSGSSGDRTRDFARASS